MQVAGCRSQVTGFRVQGSGYRAVFVYKHLAICVPLYCCCKNNPGSHYISGICCFCPAIPARTYALEIFAKLYLPYGRRVFCIYEIAVFAVSHQLWNMGLSAFSNRLKYTNDELFATISTDVSPLTFNPSLLMSHLLNR